jgi:hypothetical protein
MRISKQKEILCNRKRKPHAIIPHGLAMTSAVMAGQHCQELPLQYRIFSCLIALILKGEVDLL